jgi:4-hydroxybenzoate polyprenyltransferase
MKIDSLTVNTPKNAIQYLVGFSLYLLVYGSFEPIKFVLGLVSFLITYAAIYPYNDLMDFEVDKKDGFKQKYKALVRGELKPTTAITMVFGFPIIGLMLASMVSSYYMMLLIILLFINFLYSSPYTRLKSKTSYAVISMFLMQVIKFCLGWFTFTSEVTSIPIWIILTFSFSYLLSYLFYKKGSIKKMKDTYLKHKKIMIPLSLMTLFSFAVSILIYPYKIPMMLLFPAAFLILATRKEKDRTTKSFRLLGITNIILSTAVISLLLLNVPFINSLNQGATEAIDRLSTITLESMNNQTYEIVSFINDTLYNYPIHDLREFDDMLNVSSLKVTINNNSPTD